MYLEKTCIYCGSPYVKKKYYSLKYWHKSKYCSVGCHNKACVGILRTSETKNCLICDKEIMVSLSQSKNGRGKYCSRKCAAIGKTGVSRLDMLGNNFGLNNIAWNKGIRICLNSGRTHIKKGNIPHNKGVVGVRKASKETKLKQSLAQKGENGSNWQGGKSFEGYPMKFDRWLREDIRDRDGRMCRECNSMEIDLVEKLQVHHIDYNKQNNDPGNLLSLCRSCHAKTNFNREDWITHFQFNSAYRIEAI